MKQYSHIRDPNAALLRTVPPEYWGDMTDHILEAARRAGTRVTVIEGLVTAKLRIVLHEGRKPTKKVLARYAAEELAAAPAEGGMQ